MLPSLLNFFKCRKMHLQVKEMKVVSSKNFLTKLYHHPPDIGKLLIFPKDGGVDYENQF